MFARSTHILLPALLGGMIVATAATVHFVLAAQKAEPEATEAEPVAKEAEPNPKEAGQPTGHAQAMFLIPSRKKSLLTGDKWLTEMQFQRICQSQAAAVHNVLIAALRDPAVSQLPFVRQQREEILSDKPSWLSDALSVTFPGQGEVMVIELRLPKATTEESQAILDAITKAYRDEVVDVARRRNMDRIESLQRKYATLHNQVTQLTTSHMDLAKELDWAPNSDDATNLMLLNEISLCEKEIMSLERRVLEIAANTPSIDIKKLYEEEQAENDQGLSERSEDSQDQEKNADRELRLATAYVHQLGSLAKKLDGLKEQLKTRTEPNVDLEMKRLEIERLNAMLDKVFRVCEELKFDLIPGNDIAMIQEAQWIEPDSKGDADQKKNAAHSAKQPQ